MEQPKRSLKQHRVALPAQLDDLARLEPGHVVYLDGVVHTAREGVYWRVLEKGETLPVNDPALLGNATFHCSPAAVVDENGAHRIGGVTATASFRFSKWMGSWLDLTGARIVIGKGGMNRDDYRNILAPRGAIYLTTVGYGTGALLGRGVKEVVDVHWLGELGIAQALWVFRVENFGPFIVDSDLTGASLFAEHGAIVNRRLDSLYEGLKPPSLGRYGETGDRKRELL